MAGATLDFFHTHGTPDLGCFVRRKHEVTSHPWNIFEEFAPSIDLNVTRHQTYFRVKCGKAAFFQRALVLKTIDASVPGPVLQNFPPDWMLGGDFTPHPSDWQHYPPHSGQAHYWFFGQHRNPAASAWVPDRLSGHSYDIYENGTLSTVHFDDTGGDRDMDDFILEVAVVDRTLTQVFEPVAGQTDIVARFEREAMSARQERFVYS